jgi:hypothetical protein
MMLVLKRKIFVYLESDYCMLHFALSFYTNSTVSVYLKIDFIKIFYIQSYIYQKLTLKRPFSNKFRIWVVIKLLIY